MSEEGSRRIEDSSESVAAAKEAMEKAELEFKQAKEVYKRKCKEAVEKAEVVFKQAKELYQREKESSTGESATFVGNNLDEEGRNRLQFDKLIQGRVAKALDEWKKRNPNQRQTNKGDLLKQAREVYERECAKTVRLHAIEMSRQFERSTEIHIQSLQKDLEKADLQEDKDLRRQVEIRIESSQKNLQMFRANIARETAAMAMESEEEQDAAKEEEESEKDLETLELELKQAQSNERAAYYQARADKSYFLGSIGWSEHSLRRWINNKHDAAKEMKFKRGVASEARLRKAEAKFKDAQEKVEAAKMTQPFSSQFLSFLA